VPEFWQDGYYTGQGQVYEFYLEDSEAGPEQGLDFDDFSRFLELCGDDPGAAAKLLASTGVPTTDVARLVGRYATEVQRLRRDLRQERESKLLAIRHRLENELAEQSEAQTTPTSAELAMLIDQMVPSGEGVGPALSLSTGTYTAPSHLAGIGGAPAVAVMYNPQFISTVHGVVNQEVQGSAHFGADARLILQLIETHGSRHHAALVSDLNELEDPDAHKEAKFAAAGRLKTFLAALARKTDQVATPVLIKYLESKAGLS
jgi:hypothetical protein